MFTGIVAARGAIVAVEPLGADAGVRLTVDAGGLGLEDVAIGDSIAIQGACMTAVRLDGNRFVVEVSRESLSKTVGLDRPGPVNLEKALRLSDRLGGHLVSGHVDGLGEVVLFEPVGESWHLQIRVPAALARYFATKGSVTVNGVSLTVNEVVDEVSHQAVDLAVTNEAGVAPGPGPVIGATTTAAAPCVIGINLIPHTVEVTTLGSLKPGDAVNLEVDLIARYCERMLSGAGWSRG